MPVPDDKYDGGSSFTEDNERVRVSSTDGEDVSESAAQVKEEEEGGEDISQSAAQVTEEEDGEDISESAAQVKEEEEECGFCIFMKQGPCGERFKLWQDCVEGAEKEEKDIVEQCAHVTTLLKVCMEMNPQYYGPVLEAEKAMEADLASSDKTSSDGAESWEPPAGREEDAESENAEYPIETTEVSVDVVDREGQVVESVDVVEVEIKAI